MSLEADIRADTDRCVMCGLCLPHCPTYRLTANEAESPRGRISLIQALAGGRLEASATLQAHLDHCLSCRACERMCPSQVRYGRLFHGARELLARTRPTPPPERRALELLGGAPKRRLRLRRRLRLYQMSGLQGIVRATHLLRGELGRAEALLPPLPARRPLPEFSPALGEARGEVALFTGCTGELLEQEALHAAIYLLNRCGFSVRVPTAQGCCGALHLHAGQTQAAARLTEANHAAFADPALAAVVGIASGCTATLAEQLGGTAPVQDISAFLDAHWPAGLQPAPLPERVALHTPCSLRNVLRTEEAPRRLLQRIPQLELIPLDGDFACCGAAGSYMLSEPAYADALREEKLTALRTSGAARLVSSNIGCALHLAAGARAAGLPVTLAHPVTLLARQLHSSD